MVVFWDDVYLTCTCVCVCAESAVASKWTLLLGRISPDILLWALFLYTALSVLSIGPLSTLQHGFFLKFSSHL